MKDSDKEKIAKIIPRVVKPRAYQMTLGSLIKALQRKRLGLFVKTSTGNSPGGLQSYWKYPTDLAFEFGDPITVEALLKICNEAMRTEFVGISNDIIMKVNTPLWVSEVGESSGHAIVDVSQVDDIILLSTIHMD
jgi:hypothetical protein